MPYVLYHHEWWNGKGYPYGLKGADIPREGRLLAIVDAFDAMTSDRPYRRSVSVDEALTEMRKQSGVCFDPEMVEVFIRSYKA
ncbi:MAG: HD domain-containing phosphohydrolase [Anaerolineales bacterium]|nr:HD domain-containing phosphohydrolase [Anaerolineales bacterium]